VTDELKMAITKGYIIDRIYEVWHFDNVEQYDPKRRINFTFDKTFVFGNISNVLCNHHGVSQYGFTHFIDIRVEGCHIVIIDGLVPLFSAHSQSGKPNDNG
jgi:hypothetical protein